MRSLFALQMTRMFGTRKESEVAGFFVFSHIQMMDYFRLGKGQRVPPARVRYRRKATVNI